MLDETFVPDYPSLRREGEGLSVRVRYEGPRTFEETHLLLHVHPSEMLQHSARDNLDNYLELLNDELSELEEEDRFSGADELLRYATRRREMAKGEYQYFLSQTPREDSVPVKKTRTQYFT